METGEIIERAAETLKDRGGTTHVWVRGVGRLIAEPRPTFPTGPASSIQQGVATPGQRPRVAAGFVLGTSPHSACARQVGGASTPSLDTQPSPSFAWSLMTSVTLLCGAMVAVLACGTPGDAGDARVSTSVESSFEGTTTGQSGGTVSSLTTSATADEALSASPLQRADEPPSGLVDQFSLSLMGNGGGDACPGPFEAGPGIVPVEWDDDPFEVAVGGAEFWCLPNFDPDERITLELRAPGGHTVEIEVPSLTERHAEAAQLGYDEFDSENWAYWSVFPTQELGEYTVTASQGTRIATVIVRVRNADEPVIDVQAPWSGRPGTTFTFGLAGFPPESAVPLHLFRAEATAYDVFEFEGEFYGEYRYATTLEVMTDRLGRATLELQTHSSDPVGGYAFYGATSSVDYGWPDVQFVLTPSS